MTKRGRKKGAWPQRHLRVAADAQELEGIHEAVPNTRQRVVVLLVVPTLIEALQEIDVAIAAMQYEKARLLTADIRTLLEGEKEGERNGRETEYDKSA